MENHWGYSLKYLGDMDGSKRLGVTFVESV